MRQNGGFHNFLGFFLPENVHADRPNNTATQIKKKKKERKKKKKKKKKKNRKKKLNRWTRLAPVSSD